MNQLILLIFEIHRSEFADQNGKLLSQYNVASMKDLCSRVNWYDAVLVIGQFVSLHDSTLSGGSCGKGHSSSFIIGVSAISCLSDLTIPMMRYLWNLVSQFWWRHVVAIITRTQHLGKHKNLRITVFCGSQAHVYWLIGAQWCHMATYIWVNKVSSVGSMPGSTKSLTEIMLTSAWTSCQICKIAGCACTGNVGNVFPATAG